MKVALIDLPQAGKRTLFCLLTGRTVPDSDGFPSKRRTGSSVTDFLFHPGEYHIEASSPIRSVTVSYPPLQLAVLGWDVNWLLWFFVLSIVTGYLFKRPLGVEV